MDRRLIVQYSLPRSGSTYIEIALREYFLKHGNYRPLSEYFNLNLPVTESEKEIELDLNFWLPHDYKYTLPEDEFQRQKEMRLELLLNKSKRRYFLKLLGFQLERNALRKLLDQSFLILSHRENTWEHLLSFMISFHKNSFYEQEGLKWEPGEILATRESFDDFKGQYLLYRQIKLNPLPKIDISFETFLAEKGDYMKSLGFTGDFDWNSIAFPPKQNKRNKEEAIKNLAELQSWHHEFFILHRL
jgi:hypothetical protein